jgi:hypothetical protein
MASSVSVNNNNNKFVTDITSWELIHPKESVKIFFRRKSNGGKYFTCSPPTHSGCKPIFMSCSDLSRVFDEVTDWHNEKYVSHSCTNEWGTVISEFPPSSDTNRITLVFALHNNIESFSVRNWWRPSATGVFRPSPIGFMVIGKENIKSFIEMRKEILKRTAEVSKLENLISKAHELLYSVHKENSAFYPGDSPILDILDIEKFTYLWNEEMKFPMYKELEVNISARDIYTHTTTDELASLKEYIESSRHFDDLRHQAQEITPSWMD